MLERPLRIAATVLSLLVLAGFATFAVQEMGKGSTEARERVAGTADAADPTPAGERTREQRNTTVREWVDDANDVLLKPFASLVDTGDGIWIQRGVPALLGLLLYGFGLAYLGRFTRGWG